jgi:thiamine-monophosphate kinase
VLALSLPRDRADRDAWVDGLAAGVRAAGSAFGIRLVGGDVTAVLGDRPIVVSTTAGGAVVGPPRSRAGARPGDTLWVTGWPGLAGVGWQADDPPPEALAALRRPAPPLALALELDVATAAMDLSDGLAADLPRLAAASGVRAILDADRIPLHPAVAATSDPMHHALGGGEDYQLLFTAPPAASDRIGELGARYAVGMHPVGRIVAGSGVELAGMRAVGAWPSSAFAHFTASPADRGPVPRGGGRP